MNREVRGPETGGATPRSGTGGGTLAVVAVGLVLLLAETISVPIAVATVAAVIT